MYLEDSQEVAFCNTWEPPVVWSGLPTTALMAQWPVPHPGGDLRTWSSCEVLNKARPSPESWHRLGIKEVRKVEGGNNCGGTVGAHDR
jgi:hypothetical protein